MLSASNLVTTKTANGNTDKIIDENGVYHPGMLKVSPNSGFSQFKKPIISTNEEGKYSENHNSQEN
jgi:hypothetical protein